MIYRRTAFTVSAKPWEWLTILSLDAPLVAVLWQELFASSLGIPLQPYHYSLLGLSVWLVYVADRWLDGLKLKPFEMMSSRHAFYARWRRPVLLLWCIGLLIGIAMAGFYLTPIELTFGLVLMLASVFYLGNVHYQGVLNVDWFQKKKNCKTSTLSVARGYNPLLLKEAQVGLLFAAGILLFILPKLSTVLNASYILFGLGLAAFVLLCFVNCSLIALWEKALDESQDQSSIIQKLPKLEHSLPTRCLFLAVLTSIVASLTLMSSFSIIFTCTAASFLCLYILHKSHKNLQTQTIRVLADAVLLTPLIPLLLSHV